MPIFGGKKIAEANARTNEARQQVSALTTELNSLTGTRKQGLNQMLTKVKDVNALLSGVAKDWTQDGSALKNDIRLVQEWGEGLRDIQLTNNKIGVILQLCATDSTDLLKLLTKINIFESRWTAQDNLGISDKQRMIEEHKVVVAEFNEHNLHMRQLDPENKLSGGSKLGQSIFNIGGKNIAGNELHTEGVHLVDALDALVKEMRQLEEKNNALNDLARQIKDAQGRLSDMHERVTVQVTNALTHAHTVNEMTGVIKTIENRLYTDIDYDLLQKKHGIHNDANFQQVTDGSANHGTWNYSGPKDPQQLARRGA